MKTGDRVVDVPALMDRLEGDMELLKELVALYVEDEPGLLAEIDRAIEGGDADGVRRAAHTLKGAVSNFCAPAAQAAALELETAGRAGVLDGAPAALARLRDVLDKVRAELGELSRRE
jgi:HPt (histidine-containing phosphotransfer) domain-containing protein